MRRLSSSFALLTFIAVTAFAQGTPIQGTAQLNIAPSQSQVGVGGTFSVELTVDLSSVTGQTGTSSRGPAVLGAYVINVSFDRTKVQLTSVNGGSSSQFSGAPTATDTSSANANGSVVVASQQTSSSAPTGNVSVAVLQFTAIAGGNATLSAEPSSLSSAFQVSAPNSPASIPGNGGSASVAVGSTPSAPTLLSPADGATNVSPPVTLSWSAVPGAEQYTVFFGTSENPSQLGTTGGTSVNVTTSEGTTHFWRVVATSSFGSASSGVASFRTAGTAPCPTPTAPSIAPSKPSVGSGETYTISWTAAADATQYLLEEATRSDFSGATARTVIGTTSTFSHSVTAETSYFYRVTAQNRNGCSANGPASAIVTVVVRPQVVPPSPTFTAVIPVVGSAAGNLGSFFKTSVQLFNTTSELQTGRIIFHPQGASGSANDPSLTYTIQPGATVSYGDLLPAMGQNGVIGSADVITISGRLPLALIRIFNDSGASGTSGMTEPLLDKSAALSTGESGSLIAPLDIVAARLNVGVRSLEQGATLSVTLRDSSGTVKKTLSKTYAPTYFEQVTSAAFLGADLASSDTITVTVTAGSAIVYGATTDNKTQDPSLQLATK